MKFGVNLTILSYCTAGCIHLKHTYLSRLLLDKSFYKIISTFVSGINPNLQLILSRSINFGLLKFRTAKFNCICFSVCIYNGTTYNPGNSFTSVNGCNNRSCNTNFTIIYTDKACPVKYILIYRLPSFLHFLP